MSDFTEYYEFDSGKVLTDYVWNRRTGEITLGDLGERFEDSFDQIIGPVVIGDTEYSASYMLRNTHPADWVENFNGWLDSEIDDGIFTEDLPELIAESGRSGHDQIRMACDLAKIGYPESGSEEDTPEHWEDLIYELENTHGFQWIEGNLWRNPQQ